MEDYRAREQNFKKMKNPPPSYDVLYLNKSLRKRTLFVTHHQHLTFEILVFNHNKLLTSTHSFFGS
jgi:hypothetical protein